MNTEQRARSILDAEYKRTHDANPRANLDEATYGLALRAVMSALSPPASAAVVPEGWCLVPVDPTKEMLEAAQGSTLAYGPRQLPKHATLRRKWTAMLATTPSPPVGEKGGGS